MQHLLKFAALFLFGSLLLFTGCDEDSEDPTPPVGSTDNAAPTLVIQNNANMTMAQVMTSNPSQLVSVQLVADDADDNLSEISFRIDDVLAPATGGASSDIRLEIGGTVAGIADNPVALSGADTTGFTKEAQFRGPATAGESVVYTITVVDSGEPGTGANPEEASVTLTIMFEQPSSQLTEQTGVEFYNADGPSPGALDLDTGTAVASSSTESELQDDGVLGSGTWRQTFRRENNTRMYLISNPSNTGYDDINTLDELLAVLNDPSQVTDPVTISNRVSANGSDQYIVTRNAGSANADYYLINFTEVVDNPGTNDGDKYVLDIKRN